MRQWYLTRGKEQRAKRRRESTLTGTLQAKQHKPNVQSHHESAAVFTPEYHERHPGEPEEYAGVFTSEEIETIKDVIYDYLNDSKEPPQENSVLGGVAGVLGTAALPALVKTAVDHSSTIKRMAGSFLGRLSTQQNGAPSKTPPDWSSQTQCQQPLSSNVCVDVIE